MSVRKSYIYHQGFWFLTITCTDFLPLIEAVNVYDFVYELERANVPAARKAMQGDVCGTKDIDDGRQTSESMGSN